jgi:hypothetical protein
MDVKGASGATKPALPVEKMAQEAIEEARMVLPGIQALFGFQLIAVFNERFHRLAGAEQALHYIALLLVALAIAIIMTPAAYHRLVERETVTHFFVRLASCMIAAAMVPPMLALALEVYLVGQIVLQDQATSAVIAAAVLLLFAGLWFGFPLAMRNRMSGG